VQRIIAERVVSLAWKLRRVARAEEAVAREMHDNAVATWKYERDVNLAHDRFIFRGRDRPRRQDGATLLAASWKSERHTPTDGRLLQLTEYELKLDGALRAAVRELLKLQKEAGAFADGEEGPEEIAGEQNEANEEPEEPAGEPRGREEPDEPEAPAESETPDTKPQVPDSDRPAGETKPTPSPAAPAEPPAVTGLAAESSAPAPGTSASPPPAPRR
jgi:hypothetical protein